jgi:hypothetical protein
MPPVRFFLLLRTQDRNRRAAVDLRLRPRGHWDRLPRSSGNSIYHNSQCTAILAIYDLRKMNKLVCSFRTGDLSSRVKKNIMYFHSISSKQIWQNKFQFPPVLNGFEHAMVLRVTSRYKLIVECNLPIPLAARSKAWVCGFSLAGTVGSNPGGDMDVCLFKILPDGRSMCRADHSSTDVLPSVVCPISVIAKPRKGRPWIGIWSKSNKK